MQYDCGLMRVEDSGNGSTEDRWITFKNGRNEPPGHKQTKRYVEALIPADMLGVFVHSACRT
jgi:hypothetical protein